MASNSPKPLKAIPLDILKEIAGYIDRRTAFNLCLVCKSLRDAGEIKVWEGVDITSSIRPQQKMMGPTGPVTVPMEDTERERIVQIEAKRVIGALRSYPARIDFVEQLFIEPWDGADTGDIIDIIKLVHANLKVLAILPWSDIFVEDTVSETPTNGFYPSLYRVKPYITFPRVSRLDYKQRKRDTKNVLEVIRLCPNLRVINGEQMADELLQVEIPTFPTLTHVKRVCISNVGEVEGMNIATGILRATPNVEWLHLNGIGKQDTRHPLLGVIRSLKKLERLQWVFTNTGEPHLWRERPESLQSLDLESSGGADEINEIMLHPQNSEMSLFKMPRLPNVKRMLLHVDTRMSMLDYAELGVRYIPPEKRQSWIIGADFVRRLRFAAKLVEVPFIALTENDCRWNIALRPWDEPEPGHARDEFNWPVEVYPVDQWEKVGRRGMVIRTYVNPRAGTDLVHVRILSRAEFVEDQVVVGARRRWHELTRYRGKTVPYPKIKAIYDMAEINPDWIDGGRGLTLPDEAWTELDEWWAWSEERGIGSHFDTMDEDDEEDDEDDDEDEDEEEDDDAWAEWEEEEDDEDVDDIDDGIVMSW